MALFTGAMMDLFTYTWNSQDETDDVPHFEFIPESGQHGLPAQEESPWMKRQFVMAPFIDYDGIHDGQVLWQDPEYMTQEVRKNLRFDEALMIRWIRDNHEGQWEKVAPQWEKIERRIKRVLRKITWNRQGDEWYNKYWKHIAMCAVWEI